MTPSFRLGEPLSADRTSTILNDSGIAISGGGLRASLYGAGVLSAIDNRNSSTAGGLWQLASHLSGLSGGSWSAYIWRQGIELASRRNKD